MHLKIDTCNVGCPTQKHFGDGARAIPLYLKAIATDQKGLKGISLVVDADDKPGAVFADMAAAMKNAGFVPPTKSFAIETQAGIRVGVYTQPGVGQEGTLDNLLLEAVYEKTPKAKQCVDQYADCTDNVKNWKSNMQAKMRLSSIVAAYCEDNPWSSLAYVWNKKGNPIPIDSNRFTALSEFLKAFVS